MPNLLDAIQVIAPDDNEEPEDIFAAAPGLIFPDDLQIMHGDPRATIVYKSQRFGNIELKTADPEGEVDRRLFGHYLWNAGIKMANVISQEGDSRWSVKGHRVLELGAGVGLVGIVAVHAGAEEVVMSDYPSEALLETLRANTRSAFSRELRPRHHIQGYAWGDTTSEFARLNAHSFTRVLAADCFWMPYEHQNLVRSMLHFLDTSAEARILAFAGFHTGRANVAAFFTEALAQNLVTEEIFEEDSDGQRREWVEERVGGAENVTERKRWLVIATLRRALQ